MTAPEVTQDLGNPEDKVKISLKAHYMGPKLTQHAAQMIKHRALYPPKPEVRAGSSLLNRQDI